MEIRKRNWDLVKVLGIGIGIVGVMLVMYFWLRPLQSIGWVLMVVGIGVTVFARIREIADEKERARKRYSSSIQDAWENSIRE